MMGRQMDGYIGLWMNGLDGWMVLCAAVATDLTRDVPQRRIVENY